MAFRQTQDNFDDDTGAPEWMVTFSDCMTLLLTFFVLLISFSSFDEKVFKKMESALAEGLSSLSLTANREREAFRPTPEITYEKTPEKGSETPTVDGKYESNPRQSFDFMDFQNQKVFLLPSDDVFWGRGTLVSSHGRQLFADIAALVESIPNRLVVSEHGLEDTDNLGLERAWKIARFLTERYGLEKTRLSISSSGTVDKETIRQSGLLGSDSQSGRVLEITILDRSTYQ